MLTKFIMAGHGGQGVIFMGTLLAHSAMSEGKEVTLFPTYEAEVRGGPSDCSLIISSQEVASPVVDQPDVLIAMNEPSFHRFEHRVIDGGTVFINRSLVSPASGRDDLKVVSVPAGEIAQRLGSPAVANMVMLGAVIKATGIVLLSTVMESLKSVLPERRHNLLGINWKALEEGYERGLTD